MWESCTNKWLLEYQSEVQLVTDVTNWLTHRVLPNSGGWLDQEAIFLQALSIVTASMQRVVDGAKRTTE